MLYGACSERALELALELRGLLALPARKRQILPLRTPHNVTPGPTGSTVGGGGLHFALYAPDSSRRYGTIKPYPVVSYYICYAVELYATVLADSESQTCRLSSGHSHESLIFDTYSFIRLGLEYPMSCLAVYPGDNRLLALHITVTS